MLCLLGIFGGVSLVASDLTSLVAWPAAFLVLVHGFRLARDEARKPVRALVIADDGAQASVDADGVLQFSVRWRGPLAFASWRDLQGRHHRLVWWPDTLPAASRRELRMAVTGRVPAQHIRSMAT